MKYSTDDKAPKKIVEDRIHEICIEEIGEEYRLLWESDDGGRHIVVAFEGKCPSEAKQLLPGKFMGWRLIRKICPDGYLKAYHPLKTENES